MTNIKSTWLSVLIGLGMILGAMRARGDVLVATDGERFVGTVEETNATNVVFESKLAGHLVFLRNAVSDLLITPVAQLAKMPAAVTNPPAKSLDWKPPGVGTDGADWVQLKSGEWLRGQLKYVQNKEVEFDSDEMEQQTLKLKNVRCVYPAQPVFTQFVDRAPVYGPVVISNDVVMVSGTAPLSQSREDLIGITTAGNRPGLKNWSGKASVAFSLQSGNTHQTTMSASAELARRTPSTTLLLDYLGNYSESDNIQIANNNRFNSTYDIRLGKDWFIRPVQFEFYQDDPANINYRLTAGVGGGYYVFDRTGLEWTLSAGPSYQYTRFGTVGLGEADYTTTPAAGLQSSFKADITRRLTFIQSWQSTFTSERAGLYTHHMVSTLEFEVKRHLDLDVSLVWDYLQNPQGKSDDVVPQKSDLYLNVGFGVRF